MKLRTKLIISLCIIVFVPIAATIALLVLLAPAVMKLPSWEEVLPRAYTGLVLILIATGVLCGLWLWQGIVNPVRKLTDATRMIRDGNFDFELNTEEAGEIGELSQSLEEMRMALKESSEEKLISEQENKDLIQNISHDLKTPITAIKGYAEGLLDGVADTPEKQEKYLRTIYTKADEMTVLINELTLYSEIDTNRIPYNFARIGINDFFEDVSEEIKTDLESAGIQFDYRTMVDDQVCIIADPEQLHRVIGNIISNSVKYLGRENGEIDISLLDVGDFVEVRIKDNGRGIRREDLPHIFDRFYRADDSRNSGTGGSGIGLSIVKKIIEDHGGKIWAESIQGQGTTMHFVLRKFPGPEKGEEKKHGKDSDR